MPRDRVEVLDHHLGLLRDVVGMQLEKARERPGGLLPLDLGIVLDGLEQLEIGAIRGVVLEHIEDEHFLDCPSHRVAVGRLAVPPEHRERLVLGRRGEREETEVCLPAAFGHVAEELLHVRHAFFGGALPCFFPQPISAQHSLEIGCRLAALGAVGFVHDDGATPGGENSRTGCTAFFGHREQPSGDEGKFLQGGDDHRHGAFQRFGEFPRASLDSLHHSESVFELVNRVLELLVQDNAVRDDDHAVEHAFIRGVVQGGEPMREPADRVALAAAGRVFHQIVVPRFFAARGVHQQPNRLELVVAREDHRLDLDPVPVFVALLVHLQVNESGQKVEEALPLKHLLPQVRRSVSPPLRVRRVPASAVATPVEWKKAGRLTGEAGRHEHRLGVHGEVHEGAALELEDGFAGVAIVLVLPARLFDALASERILQFQRGDRNAVEAQCDVHGLLGSRREVELPGQPEAVRDVAGFEVRVQFVGSLEVGRVERSPIAFEPVAQRREGTVLVHPCAQVAEDLLLGVFAVQGLQLRPGLRLGLPDERKDCLGEDGALAVECPARDRLVSVRQQVRFNRGLEGGLGVPSQVHAGILASRWSIHQTPTWE